MSFKKRYGLVKPRGPYNKVETIDDIDKSILINKRRNFRRRICRLISKHNILPELIINIDQIEISIFPDSNKSRKYKLTLLVGLSKTGIHTVWKASPVKSIEVTRSCHS